MAEVISGTTQGTSVPRMPADSDVAGTGAEQVRRVTEKARERAEEEADRGLGIIRERLTSFAGTIERATRDEGTFERELGMRAATYMRRAADAMEGKNLRDITDTARTQLRERPGLVMFGLVGLGFIGGRLLKR